MKITAAVTTEPGAGFALQPLELDEPRPDEVRVAVRATDVCHTDLSFAERGRTPMPVVFGHEGAGVVEAVGANVSGVAAGDRVLMSYDSCGECPSCRTGRPFYCSRFDLLNFAGRRRDGTTALSDARGGPVGSHFFGQSTFASHANVRARTLVPLPDDVPFEVAAPLGCGVMTGAGAVLNALQVRPGSALAIVGLGGVGLGALMAAGLAGARPIVGIDPVPARRALARELGADETLDPAEPSFPDALLDAAGGGLEQVFDTSGRQETVSACFAALHPGGRLVTVSAPVPPIWSFDGMQMMKGRSVRGLGMGEAVPQDFVPLLLDAWRAGRFPIERIITAVPTSEMTAAAEAMRAHELVKAVLLAS